MDFVTIDILKLEQQYNSSEEIINLSMNLITNRSFKNHPISWETIQLHLIHPSESVMKAMFCHQNLNVLPKYCPKKLNKAPCTIYCTEKMTIFPKATTVDRSNIQPVQPIHTRFAFYNVDSIRGFTSVLTFVCEKTRIIW